MRDPYDLFHLPLSSEASAKLQSILDMVTTASPDPDENDLWLSPRGNGPFLTNIFTLISLRTSVDQLPFPESGKTNVFWNLKGYAGCFQSANLTQGTLWKEKVATGVEGSLVYFALRILGRPVNTSSSDAPLAWNAGIPLTLLFRGAPLTISVGAFNLKRRSPASRKFLSPPAGTFGSKETALFLTRFCLPKELGSRTSRLSSFVRVLDSPLLPNLIC